MIGFNHQHATGFQLIGNQPGRQTKVGGKPDFPLRRLNGKADRIDGVMGGRKGIYRQSMTGELVTSVEQFQPGDGANFRQNGIGLPIDIDWQIIAARQWPDTTDMIMMFVGDEDPMQVLSSQPEGCQASLRFSPRKAGINQ